MRRELKNSHRFAGYTLTEVVAASVLLLIVVVPILKALTSAHLTDVAIERKTRCLMLAQAKLDNIKARSIYSFSSNFAENNVHLDGAYLGRVISTVPGPELKKISVLVGYDNDGNGSLSTPEVQVTLVTNIARRW